MEVTGQPVTRSRTRVVAYKALGVVFLGLALAGVVLPLVPVTINTILAGFFFARSSERFDSWLVNHKTLGPIIRDYRAGVGFSVRAKTIAMTAMSLSIAVSTWWALYQGAPAFVAAIMAAVWVYASWFILKQPTKPRPAPASAA